MFIWAVFSKYLWNMLTVWTLSSLSFLVCDSPADSSGRSVQPRPRWAAEWRQDQHPGGLWADPGHPMGNMEQSEWGDGGQVYYLRGVSLINVNWRQEFFYPCSPNCLGLQNTLPNEGAHDSIFIASRGIRNSSCTVFISLLCCVVVLSCSRGWLYRLQWRSCCPRWIWCMWWSCVPVFNNWYWYMVLEALHGVKNKD